MTDNYQDARDKLFEKLDGAVPGSDQYEALLKQLALTNEADTKDPNTHKEVEATGVKAWFGRNSDTMLKIGGTTAAIALVGFIETKFDVLFRSKATSFMK